jgi:hypothetical protein
MTLHGHIQDGEIVLAPHGPLPEGATVQVLVNSAPAKQPGADEGAPLPTLAERYKEFAGCLQGDLPADAALNHDHYLYGAPKAP